MRIAVFALSFAFAAPLSLLPTDSAEACAMFRPRRVEPATLVASAERYEKAGEFRLAIRNYERVMNLASRHAPARVRADAAWRAARLHARLGNVDRAETRLARAGQIGSRRADARLAYARELIEKDDARAKRVLLRARKGPGAEPVRAEVEAHLAAVRARLGQRKPARRHLERARKLGADDALIRIAEAALAPPTGQPAAVVLARH